METGGEKESAGAMRNSAGVQTGVKSSHAVFQVQVEGTPEARKQSNAYRASSFVLVRNSCSWSPLGAAVNGAVETKRRRNINTEGLRPNTGF